MNEDLRPDLARRLLWEAQAMRHAAGSSMSLIQTPNGAWFWDGTIPVLGRAIPVRIAYPLGYPGAVPTLETSVALPAMCPHVLGRRNGLATLCWIAPASRSAKRRWDPQRHTAATVFRAAQRWFLAFLVWQETNEWPVADAWDVAEARS